jgi:hypothetical protein
MITARLLSLQAEIALGQKRKSIFRSATQFARLSGKGSENMHYMTRPIRPAKNSLAMQFKGQLR